ncbi:MAG: hypothetical protein AAFV07_11565 [Bacteroidota bacterium]
MLNLINQSTSMGLDITLFTDKDTLIRQEIREKGLSELRHFGLSRTFCNLMLRQYEIREVAELHQIGDILSLDLSPLIQMTEYPEEDYVDFLLRQARTEDEKQKILQEATSQKQALTGNLSKVLKLVNIMIEKLSQIPDLPKRFRDNNPRIIPVETYFATFNEGHGDGYKGNNFGRDMRNLQQNLRLAEELGAQDTYFVFG